MGDATMEHGNGTTELVEPEPTMELLNAKLDHIIIQQDICVKTAERAYDASARAEEKAEQARIAAERAATHALSMVKEPPLTRFERYGAVFTGAAMAGIVGGGAVLALAASIASCLHR